MASDMTPVGTCSFACRCQRDVKREKRPRIAVLVAVGDECQIGLMEAADCTVDVHEARRGRAGVDRSVIGIGDREVACR